MQRDHILAKANLCVSENRAALYGDAGVNLDNIAKLWTAYLACVDPAKGLTAVDAANMLALFKVARSLTSAGHADNFIDACGYLALAGELANSQ